MARQRRPDTNGLRSHDYNGVPTGLLFFGLKSRPTTNGLRPCSPEVRTLSWVRTFTPYIEDALKERPTEVTGNGYRLTNLLTYDGLKGRLTLLSC
uniref:Uncharacterized protein n=1 Tax=Siphoviridae sp. ctGkF2 TaxID=2827823 RepID=A0A8S5TME9_9CAUD|nr:MAG TPA: hypothetical protein [Siphoviridae sp. ctGkF2]